MKKLLILTILITTYLQAEEEATEKQKICRGNAQLISLLGLKNCKEGDILFETEIARSDILLLRICKLGTIKLSDDTTAKQCVLRAEKDFLQITNHEAKGNENAEYIISDDLLE